MYLIALRTMQFRIPMHKQLQSIFQNSREFTDVNSSKEKYWPLEYSHHHKFALHIQKEEDIPLFPLWIENSVFRYFSWVSVYCENSNICDVFRIKNTPFFQSM